MSRGNRVLIAGVSTRAAAESAARAGFAVTALDAFADLDQHPSVQAISPARRFSASVFARASRDFECDAVVYLSAFENHPRSVAMLAAGRALWGNPPDVLKRVRDPLAVADVLRASGFAVPGVAQGFPPPLGLNSNELRRDTPKRRRRDGGSPAGGIAALKGCATSGQWLIKPRRSGGGRGIRVWHPDEEVPGGWYLQELIEGTPGSVIFVADGTRAVTLGVLRQLIGDSAFGASGYQYCGNILAAADDDLADRAGALAAAATEEFGLVGINGIDFVARNGIPWPVEINPRWCASVELLERAYDVSGFALHAAACDIATLPDLDLRKIERPIRQAFGKSIVYAQRNVTIGEVPAAGIRDIPFPGERISAGSPVCTVFASGPDADACHAALVRRAEHVYAVLDRTEPKTRML